MPTEYMDYAAPSTPGNGATVVMYNSTVGPGSTTATNPMGIGKHNVAKVIVNFLSVSHASGTAGLKWYASSDGGTNWDQIEAGISVPASTAGVVETHEYDVAPYRDTKIEYTASANNYTTWRVSVKLVRGDRVKGT